MDRVSTRRRLLCGIAHRRCLHRLDHEERVWVGRHLVQVARQTGRRSDWNQKIIEEFRANGGTVETNGFGRRLVLVHNVGAKSGQPRINPVANIPQPDGSRLIAASAAGADSHPAWYHNLLAHPDVTIETPDGEERVHVTELHGQERDAAWDQFTSMSDGFRSYEQKTDRVIPVLKLTPIAS